VFDGEALADRLCRLKFERAREIEDLFHEARNGNSVIHTQRGDQAEALTTLKVARQLGVWFRRIFAGKVSARRAFRLLIRPRQPEHCTTGRIACEQNWMEAVVRQSRPVWRRKRPRRRDSAGNSAYMSVRNESYRRP
jgi:hypothetical protein